jgi:hypothetical protein
MTITSMLQNITKQLPIITKKHIKHMQLATTIKLPIITKWLTDMLCTLTSITNTLPSITLRHTVKCTQSILTIRNNILEEILTTFGWFFHDRPLWVVSSHSAP